MKVFQTLSAVCASFLESFFAASGSSDSSIITAKAIRYHTHSVLWEYTVATTINKLPKIARIGISRFCIKPEKLLSAPSALTPLLS